MSRPVLAVLLFLFASGASAATITGRVIDPDGRAVAGARVLATTAMGTAADRTTDASGAFAIDHIAGGRYELRVIADGFQAEPTRFTLAADEIRDVQLQLRISAVAESIVVSASQVDLPLSRTADSVTVITAADLRARQIDRVADALRLVPGLGVTRSGARGAITSLFPRGGASNYTLVLVDGMRANAFGGGFDFAHLSTADVERVEIVRGPQSALFGSDAIGAVVQIVTRRGGPLRVGGSVEGGSQGTARAAAAASGSSGGWRFGVGAEKSRSDGFTGIAPATGERVSNDDDHLEHASGTLGWQRPDRPGALDLLLSGNISRSERGFPGPFGSNPIGAFSGVDRVSRGVTDTRQAGARVMHRWTDRVRQRIEANYTDSSGDFTSRFGTSASGTRRFDARVQEDAALASWLGASAGAEFVRERGSSSFVTGASNQKTPIDRAVTGLFGEVRAVARERLFVTGGVRVEHITRDAVEPNFGQFTARPAFPAQTLDSVNPKIAASYLLAASTRVRASAGTGIRPPDVFEIAFTDNPNLRPERSRSVDAGIEQQFGGGSYRVAATAFFNRYDDLIVTISRALASASRYKSDNISNARARGLELAADAALRHGFAVHAAYTFLATEILSVDRLDGLAPTPFAVGDALLRRPRHHGGVDITYTAGRASAFAELTARGTILDVEPNFGASTRSGLFFTPGYASVNIGAAVRVIRGVDLYGRVLNVGDRAYEETLGFPALRRSAIVGVRVGTNR